MQPQTRTCDLYYETKKKYPELEKKLKTFVAFKLSNVNQPFSKADYQFDGDSALGKKQINMVLRHAHMSQDVSIVYRIHHDTGFFLDLYGLFTHEDIGRKGSPKDKTRMANSLLSQIFKITDKLEETMKKLMLSLAFFSITAYADPDRNLLEPILVNPEFDAQIFLQPNSIKKIGSSVQFKLHTLFTPSRTQPYEDGDVFHKFDEPVSKMTDVVEMNCAQQTWMTVKREFYNTDDTKLWEHTPDDPEPQLVDPTQISDVIYKKLCGKRSQKQQST